MGTGCSTIESKGLDNRKYTDDKNIRNMTRVRNRIRKQSTTSSGDVNVKVNKPKQWVQPLPTPMPKASPITPEISQLTVDDKGNRLSASSASTYYSGSDGLSVSVCSTRSNNTISVSTPVSIITPLPSNIRDHWKIPPRLTSLPRDQQDLLLGHVEDFGSMKIRPRVIHLKVVAPGEECMRERLALWSNAFLPLKIFCAERGYVLDIVDNLWSSRNLDKAYSNLIIQQGDDRWMNNCLDEFENMIDVALVILTGIYRHTLPAVLSHEDYTTVLVSLPDSPTTTLFHDLYSNNENRNVPAFELNYLLMIRQDQTKIARLTELMVEVFKREHKDLRMFNSDYMTQLELMALNTNVISQAMVLVTQSFQNDAVDGSENDDSSIHDEAFHDNQTNPSFSSLRTKCPTENIIQLRLPLSDKLEDKPDAAPTDIVLTRIESMSKEVKENLERILLKLIEHQQFEDREIVTGISRALVEELTTQTRNVHRLISVSPLLQSPTLTSLQEYVNTVSEIPIVVYAEPGWGLSTMGAQLVKSCLASLSTSVIIFRSMGISPDSRNLLATLLSIKQQLDTILGPNSSPWSHNGRELPTCETLLRDIVLRGTHHMPVLIILEGVSLMSGQLKELDVMTLTESLPSTTKLLVMTSDPDVATGLRAKMKDAFYLKAMPWDSKLIAEFSIGLLIDAKRTLTDAQSSVMTAAIRNCPLPMYAKVASMLASSWTAVTEINDEDLPPSLEEMFHKLFVHLKKIIPSDCFSFMMAYLSGSVGGICKWEMADLLSVNDTVLLSIYSDVRDPPIHRAPPVLWKFISIYLHSFLNIFVSRDYYTYCWASGSIRKYANCKYVSNSVISSILHREISDHFQGRWADKKKAYPDPEEEIDLHQDRFIMPQPDMYGNYLNSRKFLCLPHHLMNSKNKNTYTIETCIFNLAWVESKLTAVSVLQVACDFEEAKSVDTSAADDITKIQQAVFLSSTVLEVDGREIYKCLRNILMPLSEIARSESPIKNNQEFIKLFTWLAVPPCSFIHPLDEVYTFHAQINSSPVPSPVINAIVPLSEDSNQVHVAAVLRSEGEIKIVNILTNTVVRTLTGVDHPQSLVMIDSTKAIVLCNRELYVLELEEGKVMTKLRGVLNLRMPLFGLQNKGKVVTLSRDRMVVNILDIQTGGIVATFKAGETRFLDSLIISKDGSILVCGDETQKPFPLLVWSLNHCKLLHDIRMSQHEFLTSLAAISDDGKYLACGCKEVKESSTNFVVLYDLVSGNLLKKFKMAAITTALAMSSMAMILVIALDTGQLAVWDIVSGNCKFILEGVHAAINNLLITPNGSSCLSYYKEEGSISSHSLAVWNINEGKLVGSQTFDTPVTSVYITSDSKMVIVGVKGKRHPVRILLIPAGADPSRCKDEWEAEMDVVNSTFGDSSRDGAVLNVCMD